MITTAALVSRVRLKKNTLKKKKKKNQQPEKQNLPAMQQKP